MKLTNSITASIFILVTYVTGAAAQGFGGSQEEEIPGIPIISAPGFNPSELYGSCDTQQDILISGLEGFNAFDFGSGEIYLAGWKWLDDALKYLSECVGVTKAAGAIIKDLAKGICRQTGLCNPDSYHCIQALYDAIWECVGKKHERLNEETKQAQCVSEVTEKLRKKEFAHCL